MRRTWPRDCTRLDLERTISALELRKAPGRFNRSIVVDGLNIALDGSLDRSPLQIRLSFVAQGQHASQTIPVYSTCYGARDSRFFWRCPDCRRMVRTLYLPPDAAAFLCRHCWKLAHR